MPASSRKMVELSRQGMIAGGVGLSSGLYYAPGSYSKTAEVIAMAQGHRAVRRRLLQPHPRRVGLHHRRGRGGAGSDRHRRAGRRGRRGVAHESARAGELGIVEDVDRQHRSGAQRGVQVFADQYPYEASGTGIVGALIPRSAQVGGRDAMMKRITGELRKEIRAEVKTNIARRGGADTLMISRYSVNPSFEGQRLSTLAAKAGVPPEEYALQLLEKGDASLVSFNMSEDDIESIMRQPWTMTCTDGDLARMDVGVPHPRAYGAFARKLKRYVGERGAIDLPTAIRSMTTLPATVFGLKDRGQLRAGAFADVLIFDLAKINDPATYDRPHQLAEGMNDIIVNGEVARRDGRFTTALSGRVLRPERQ